MSASALPMAVTMGDPSGIGPEIVAKTLLQPDYARRCVVVGDAAVMARALDSLGAADRLRVVSDVGEAVSAAASSRTPSACCRRPRWRRRRRWGGSIRPAARPPIRPSATPSTWPATGAWPAW